MTVSSNAVLAGCLAAALAPSAYAEKFFSDSSISLLHSDSYENFGKQEVSETYFTFENATGHNWGSTFFFVDSYQGQSSVDGRDDIYGEFSPALSLSWLTGNEMSAGPIADVYLAGTYEFGGGVNANNYLYGAGLAWTVPGFSYFNTTVYYVDNNQDDPGNADDWQLTVTWATPFNIGASALLFDGFIDYSTAESDHEAEFHFNPQLKLDVGNYLGNPGVFYAGIEYSYWRNKFGAGSEVMDTESAVSALLKFHF
ncbi:MAG: outer membrane protein OmpK [Pseudomonadota bacterium]